VKSPNFSKTVLGLSGLFLLALLCLSCDSPSQGRQAARKEVPDSGTAKPTEQDPPQSEQIKPERKPKAEASDKADAPVKNKPAEPKKVEVGKSKNVWLEIDGKQRRVIVSATVCLREGNLEQLLTRAGIKAHEAILTTDADARDIHTALVAAGATPGSTVKYTEDGKIIPPTGQRIKITLTYKDKEKNTTISVPAQNWVRDNKAKKSLTHDWVFAGSYLMPNPLEPDKPPLYGANSGDVITVSNFQEALLDLPINSSKNNAELEFEAFTERIPPLGTAVTVTLEPLPKAKKEK
jgi:hypothetical protein